MASSTVPAGSSGGNPSALVNYQTTPEHYLRFTPNAPYYYFNQSMAITGGTYKIWPEYATTNTTVTNRAERARVGYSRTASGTQYGATGGANLGATAIQTLALTATSTVDLYWTTTQTANTTWGSTTNSSINQTFFFGNGFFWARNDTSGQCWYATANNTGAAPVAGGTTPATFNSGAFGNGNFVSGMGGATNSLAYTNNIAGNWTNVAVAGLSGNVTALAYSTALTQFTAGTTSGQIYTSTNGVAWTLRLSGSTAINQIWPSTIGTTRWVASNGGAAGSLFTSTDGISWTARSITTTNIVYGICQWGNFYQAITYSSTTPATASFYSTDAITWTAGGIQFAAGTYPYYFAPNYHLTNPLFLVTYPTSYGAGGPCQAFYSQTAAPTNEYSFYVAQLNSLGNNFSTMGHDGAYQLYAASSGNGSSIANIAYTNFFNTATIGGVTSFYWYKVQPGTINN